MEITVCRVGNKYKLNRGSKGQFIKKFDNLEKLAKFIRDHWRVFFYPNLPNELSKEQLIALNYKTRALARREQSRIK